MTLPTPTQFEELSKLIVDHEKIAKGTWYTYKGMMQALETTSGGLASQAASTGARTGMTYAAAAVGVTTGTAMVPFGAVLAPWIAAADVARRAGNIFDLIDLKEQAASPRRNPTKYFCKCGKCFKNLKYVVDKKHRNVGRVGIAVATLGASVIVTTAYSIYKSFQSGRPKETVSRGLVESARGGCTVAIAAIFLLSGEWKFLRGGNAGIMRRATATITSEDGWKVLKDQW